MHFFRHIKSLIAFQSLPKDKNRIVFYSEGAHDWIHLQGMITELLNHDPISVAYISSNRNDPGLNFAHPRFCSFETDSQYIRNWLFENMDTPVVVMTTPDLHQFQLKKSKHDVTYVYTQHSLVSLHMAYRPGAFDHFDVIFCAGPHHVKEIRAIEKQYHLPEKQIVEHGYSRLDQLTQIQHHHAKNQPISILIAPSWGDTTIINSGLAAPLIDTLLNHHYKVTLRPHPQTMRLSKKLIDAIENQFGNNSLFSLDDNIAAHSSLENADIMISDWSGAALEFSFAYLKPVLFIDTPRKINNPDYQTLSIEPFEAACRSNIGSIISVDHIAQVDSFLKNALAIDKSSIEDFYQNAIFNIGKADHIGATYLMNLLEGNK